MIQGIPMKVRIDDLIDHAKSFTCRLPTKESSPPLQTWVLRKALLLRRLQGGRLGREDAPCCIIFAGGRINRACSSTRVY